MIYSRDSLTSKWKRRSSAAGWSLSSRFILILLRQRRALLLGTALIVVYGSALDAWAIRNGWGWFNPALTSGIWFGSLLLEEAIFWIGTAFVTVAAALVMAEAVDRGIPWWALPIAFMFPSWLWLNTPENIFAEARG